MRCKQSLKILYRSPVKTVFTFILIVAVTFALFSQVIEYSVANREMRKAVELYDGVGSIEPSRFIENTQTIQPFYIFGDERVSQGALPDAMYEEFSKYGYEEGLSDEQIEEVSRLPYITYTDTRYMTAGVSDMLRLPMESYYDFNTVCVIEAEVKNFNVANQALIVGELELVGGQPIPLSDFGEADVIIQRDPFARVHGLVFEIGEDRTAKYSWGGEKINFNIGERYVFVLRYWKSVFPRPEVFTYYLTDTFIYEQCEPVYTLAGEPENYIETEKFAPLRNYIKLIEADQYTLDVVYTKNMNSIRYFANGAIGITEGRALVPQDTENRNNVCVINHDVALQYDLSVGDKITVDLGNVLFEQNSAIGAVAVVPERFSNEYTRAELEIVGIYKNTENKYGELEANAHGWSYNLNTVFVPQHLLCADTKNWEIYPGEFSFVVENAWNLTVFTAEILPQIEEMGFIVYFEDGGFSEILAAFKETERIALIKIAILLFTITVTTWFVSMLYIVGRRSDYAVMRLLGTSKAKSAKSLLIPLGVIAILAVLIGSAAAYIYTSQNISRNASLAILSGFEIDLSIPMWVILVCIVGEIILIVLLAYMLISIIGRKSPLALMQANTQKSKKHRRKKKVYVPEPQTAVALGEWHSIERLAPNGKHRGKFALNYATRHIKRTLGKALMFIIVTALLINVAGQLLIMRESYVGMFEGSEVVSQYAGFLNVGYADELMKSDYVRNVYYCTDRVVDINREETAIIVCNDPYAYASEKGYEDFEITFLEGYDETSMYGLGRVLIMGENLMAERGIKIGDTVEFTEKGWYDKVKATAIRNFGDSANVDAYTSDEILELIKDEVEERYNSQMDEFVVIGSIKASAGVVENLVLTPGCDAMNRHYGKLIIPPSVTAVLLDNYRAEEYREYGMRLAGKNLTGEIAFVMDTSKIDNVRNNVELMNVLYPIMVAAIYVISAFLCGVLIIQSSKEISIMRVLGTSKRRVRAAMVIEHMILGVIGVALAVGVLFMRGILSQMLMEVGLYIFVILIAAYIISGVVSRKNVLELLQTKE